MTSSAAARQLDFMCSPAWRRALLLGTLMHLVYGFDSRLIKSTNAYLDTIGTGYVKSLQLIVIPLIMVSIVAVIVQLKDTAALGKISALTNGMLMLTTMVAAGLGILTVKLFGLTTVGLTATAAEVAQGALLQGSQASAKAVTLPSVVLSFIQSNPFLDMTGVRAKHQPLRWLCFLFSLAWLPPACR